MLPNSIYFVEIQPLLWQLESFFSLMFPKDPKLWATALAPVGALKSWLQRDSMTTLAPYIDNEVRNDPSWLCKIVLIVPQDLEEWLNTIKKEGIGAALCYHKV